MRCSRIHIDAELAPHVEVPLTPERSHYVRNVLRLKDGDSIHVFNGHEDLAYSARLLIAGKKVSAVLGETLPSTNSSPAHITLLQAVGKSEQMDLVVQKTTELGIDRLVFFNSQRTQSPVKGSRLQKRLMHWHAVAVSACEQCGRNRLPQMDFSQDMSHCLRLIEPTKNRLLLDFDSPSFKQLKNTFTTSPPFYVMIGPEGGFAAQEITLAKAHDFQACQLGPRTLRMETAAIVATALLQLEFGDLG